MCGPGAVFGGPPDKTLTGSAARDAPDSDRAYCSIVSRFGEGNIRILAYVRVYGGRLQRRTYDAAGDDLWVAAE